MKDVKTEFIIHQKKFEFRNKSADLGGDICITGNLKFGTPDNYKRFTMAMNGDIMENQCKVPVVLLVMGVVINAIMSGQLPIKSFKYHTGAVANRSFTT